MSVIYIVLPLSILIAGGAIGVFVWATQDGQFEDLDTPSHRILLDEEDLILASSETPSARSSYAVEKKIPSS